MSSNFPPKKGDPNAENPDFFLDPDLPQVLPTAKRYGDIDDTRLDAAERVIMLGLESTLTQPEFNFLRMEVDRDGDAANLVARFSTSPRSMKGDKPHLEVLIYAGDNGKYRVGVGVKKDAGCVNPESWNFTTTTELGDVDRQLIAFFESKKNNPELLPLPLARNQQGPEDPRINDMRVALQERGFEPDVKETSNLSGRGAIGYCFKPDDSNKTDLSLEIILLQSKYNGIQEGCISIYPPDEAMGDVTYLSRQDQTLKNVLRVIDQYIAAQRAEKKVRVEA